MNFNYFKIAWRNLIRNPVYLLINIAGLSMGTISYQAVKAARMNPEKSLRSE